MVGGSRDESIQGKKKNGINVNELRSSGVSPCHLHLFHGRTILIKDQKRIKIFRTDSYFFGLLVERFWFS